MNNPLRLNISKASGTDVPSFESRKLGKTLMNVCPNSDLLGYLFKYSAAF